MSTRIPDRWLNYTPIGKQIKGTRFIAFKVPLSANINKSVDNADTRFDISQLFEKVPNLGMVIDLTNTYKYYDSNVFEETGVKYVKIMVPGHDVPQKIYNTKFTESVNEFIADKRNTEKLIGVHCTHGVNRTGYLICHHMITSMKFSPEEAMEVFEEARGHQIERKNYRNMLTSLKQNDQKDETTNNVQSWRMPSQSSSCNNWPAKPSLQTEADNELFSKQIQADRNRNWREPTQRSSYGKCQTTSSWRRNPDPGLSSNQGLPPVERAQYKEPYDRNERTDSHRQRQSNRSQGRRPSPPISNSSRRDLLPSNDFSDRYSVMAQAYAEKEAVPSNRFSWRRP